MNGQLDMKSLRLALFIQIINLIIRLIHILKLHYLLTNMFLTQQDNQMLLSPN